MYRKHGSIGILAALSLSIFILMVSFGYYAAQAMGIRLLQRQLFRIGGFYASEIAAYEQLNLAPNPTPVAIPTRASAGIPSVYDTEIEISGFHPTITQTRLLDSAASLYKNYYGNNLSRYSSTIANIYCGEFRGEVNRFTPVRVCLFNDTIPPPDPPAIDHIIFVTSKRYPANFGGFGWADTECTTLSNQSGVLPIIAIRPSWKAILSDDDTNASERITLAQNVYNARAGLIDVPSSLFVHGIRKRPIFDEFGNRFEGDKNVWTGTRGSNGTAFVGINCLGWTSNSSADKGVAGGTRHYSGQWLSDSNNEGNEPCNRFKRLYCISQ